MRNRWVAAALGAALWSSGAASAADVPWDYDYNGSRPCAVQIQRVSMPDAQTVTVKAEHGGLAPVLMYMVTITVFYAGPGGAESRTMDTTAWSQLPPQSVTELRAAVYPRVTNPRRAVVRIDGCEYPHR